MNPEEQDYDKMIAEQAQKLMDKKGGPTKKQPMLKGKEVIYI